MAKLNRNLRSNPKPPDNEQGEDDMNMNDDTDERNVGLLNKALLSPTNSTKRSTVEEPAPNARTSRRSFFGFLGGALGLNKVQEAPTDGPHSRSPTPDGQTEDVRGTDDGTEAEGSAEVAVADEAVAFQDLKRGTSRRDIYEIQDDPQPSPPTISRLPKRNKTAPTKGSTTKKPLNAPRIVGAQRKGPGPTKKDNPAQDVMVAESTAAPEDTNRRELTTSSPNPAQGRQPNVTRVTRSSKAQNIAPPDPAPTMNGAAQESNDTQDMGQLDQGPEPEAGADLISPEPESNPREPDIPLRPVNLGYVTVDAQDLVAIIEIAQRVGHSIVKETNVSKRVVEESDLTKTTLPMTKRLQGLIQNLSEKFTELLRARDLNDVDASEEVYDSLDFSIARLVRSVDQIFDLLADTKKNAKAQREMFLVIIPEFAKLLKKAFESHAGDLPISDPALRLIETLLNDFVVLTEGCLVLENPVSFPFQTRGPARTLSAVAKRLRSLVQQEITIRTRAEQAEQKRQDTAEAKKQRKAQEAEEQRETWRRINERRQLIWKFVARNNHEEFSHSWNRAPVQQPERKRIFQPFSSNPQRLTSAQAAVSISSEDEMEDEFSFTEHDEDEYMGSETDVERLQMFPRPEQDVISKQPLQWTQEEKDDFIDIMMQYQGPDRYQVASERLGKTLEDIFEAAKDFQEAMDSAHEKGKFLEPCDEWTFSVWINRARAASELL